MNTKRVKIFFLLIPIALIFGCSTPSNKAELYGVYYAEYSVATEKLTLRADDEYIQEVNVKDNQKNLINKGHWDYEPIGKYLILEKPLVISDGFNGELNKDYNIPVPGNFLMPVLRFFPWSKIRIGSEEGVLYIKRN